MRGSLAVSVALASASVAGAAGPAEAAGGEVLVMAVPVGQTDRAAVGHLRSQLGDAEIALREVAEPRDLDALMKASRDAGSDAYVLVLDSAAARVHVLRPSDGTRISRTLDAAAVRESPYVLALAASELLELARTSPSARAAALPSAEPPPPRLEIGVSVGLGAEASTSPAHDGSVIRPRLDAELLLGALGGWWLHIGARVAPFGRWSRGIGTVRGIEGPVRVRHGRIDVGGTVGIGRASGRARLVLLALAGVSLADTEAVRAGGQVLGASSQRSAWLGGALAMRYGLGAGFALGMALEAVWLPEPTDYLVRGEPALVEGPARVRAVATVRWGFPR